MANRYTMWTRLGLLSLLLLSLMLPAVDASSAINGETIRTPESISTSIASLDQITTQSHSWSYEVIEGETLTLNDYTCWNTDIHFTVTCKMLSGLEGATFTSTVGNPTSTVLTWPNAGPIGQYIFEILAVCDPAGQSYTVGDETIHCINETHPSVNTINVISIEIKIEASHLELNPTHANPKSTLTITVSDLEQNSISNYSLNIYSCTAIGSLQTDGHVEDGVAHAIRNDPCDPGERPLARFTSLSDEETSLGDFVAMETDENGQVKLNYFPPNHNGKIISGLDYIIAESTNNPSSFHSEIEIKTWVPSLQPMPDSKLLSIKGACGVQNDFFTFERQSHHGCLFYGTTSTNVAVVQIATEFVANQNACSPSCIVADQEGRSPKQDVELTPGGNPKKVKITAMALPWGGLHDISGEWKPPHVTHNNGKMIDIGLGNFIEHKGNTLFLRDGIKEYQTNSKTAKGDIVFGTVDGEPDDTFDKYFVLSITGTKVNIQNLKEEKFDYDIISVELRVRYTFDEGGNLTIEYLPEISAELLMFKVEPVNGVLTVTDSGTPINLLVTKLVISEDRKSISFRAEIDRDTPGSVIRGTLNFPAPVSFANADDQDAPSKYNSDRIRLLRSVIVANTNYKSFPVNEGRFLEVTLADKAPHIHINFKN